VKILRLLVKKKAPLDAYEDVMKWHLVESGLLAEHEAVGNSSQFVSREKLMQKLKRRYLMDKTYAVGCHVVLPFSKSKVVVWRKKAQDNVLSLLTDPRWTEKDWLYFDDDPFAPPPKDCAFVEDLNTGEAYMETYKKLIKKDRQILVPIPLYIDGAVTGQFDKLQVTALKMSIGLLNRRARDKENAWRTLGYVTNYTKEDSQGKRIFVQSGHVSSHELFLDDHLSDEEGKEGGEEAEVDKAADYHAILEVLLQSLKDLISDGMVVDICHKGKIYKDCELVFFVPFVKCDGDEGDKLCLSYRSRNANVQQLCRYCQCPTEDTDNPKANYPYKSETILKKLYDENKMQKLKEMSQIWARNAFHGLRFGLHNDRGIHGACPLELLHAILLGIFKYVRDCFFQQVGETSATASKINSLAQVLGRCFARQSDRNKPRTKFAKGILKGKLMAKEYSGVLLVLAALLQTAEGKDILAKARKKNFREVGKVEDWILLVETLLQWEAYLNLPQMEKKHVHRLKKKHQFLLFLLKKVGARQEGMGFKVMKFHAITHLAVDILMFGIPLVVDTGSNESHHKTTKIAAKLTQKDATTFEKQTSDRMDDFHVLDLAIQELEGRPLWQYYDGYIHEEDNEVPLVNESFTGGMVVNVFWDKERNKAGFNVASRMNNRDGVALDTQFVEYAARIQRDLFQMIEKIPLLAEHKRNRIMFRAHPSYRGKGPWRDWVMIEWNVGDFPALIWGYLDLTSLPDGETFLLTNGFHVSKGVYAIIESCSYKDVEEGSHSDLFKGVILDAASLSDNGEVIERQFYLVDVETFKQPLVVIPNIGTKREFLMMTPQSKWAEDFKVWIESPHKIDENEMADGEE